MIRRCTLWMAAVLAVFTVTAVQAAEDVYHVIPSDAWAFVAVNRIAETSAEGSKARPASGGPAGWTARSGQNVRRREEGARRDRKRRAGGHARQRPQKRR